MSKRIISIIGLLALTVLMTGMLTAAAPMPNTSIELVRPVELQVLNDPQAPTPTLTMNVGETLKVSVEVTSDQQFLFAQALPSFFSREEEWWLCREGITPGAVHMPRLR